MNLAYRQVPLLRSFMQNPSVHLAASRDRTLFGGPFVHISPDRTSEVKELLEETIASCGRLLKFAADYKQFDEKVQSTARGYSPRELFAYLPPTLAGLVEILYDLNNHPRLRLYEELVYGEYFESQGYEIMLSSVKEDERIFFMSTPRLRGSPGTLSFKLPLADRRVDLLASMRTISASIRATALAFGVADTQMETFSAFFTDIAPVRNAPEYRGPGVRIRYFGHACVLIQTSSTAVLCDPMFAWDADKQDGRFTFQDLPDRIDYLVISHGHQDHCVPEMLIQLRHRVVHAIVPASNAGNLADPSLKLLLEALGFCDVTVLSAFNEVPIPDGKITSLPFPGEHVDLDIHSRQGIHIEVKGRRLAFLVDSDCWDPVLFRRIGKRMGRSLDVLFVGMECHGAPLTWLYGPLLTKPMSRRDDESRRLSGLDCARARQVLTEFSTERVFVYAMGQEPWLRYIMGLEYAADSIQLKEVAAFIEHCRRSGIPAQSLFIGYETEL
jgi:L-ascorbate metabolism protein UlaG (beta-lactamase superfamily)